MNQPIYCTLHVEDAHQQSGYYGDKPWYWHLELYDADHEFVGTWADSDSAGEEIVHSRRAEATKAGRKAAERYGFFIDKEEKDETGG